MDFQDMPWGWHIGRAASLLTPIAWLVFRVQIYFAAWTLANGDSANPVTSPARKVAVWVFGFPLGYCPWLWDWFRYWAGNNALVLGMAANALCWECLLGPLVSRRFARTLFCADALAEAFWPDRGLLQLFDWIR